MSVIAHDRRVCESYYTYLTDNEKSPGLDSLIRIKNEPSDLFDNNFSASARVIRP